MDSWVEVTKAEYYERIGSMNVNGRIVNERYPYTTEHVTAMGVVCARRVGYTHNNKGFAGYRYYLLIVPDSC